jgi:hypothetical protein
MELLGSKKKLLGSFSSKGRELFLKRTGAIPQKDGSYFFLLPSNFWNESRAGLFRRNASGV